MTQPPPDVVTAGPRPIPARRAWQAVAALLGVALAGAVLAAGHYRSQAAALQAAARVHHSAAPVTLFATTAVLPPGGPAGAVTTVTATPAGGRPQVIVTAWITSGRPHTRYELGGGDCTASATDRIWATGVTSANGSASLTSRAQPIRASDEYFLVLAAPGLYQQHPGPAVHGWFEPGRGLTPVHGGAAPCAP